MITKRLLVLFTIATFWIGLASWSSPQYDNEPIVLISTPFGNMKAILYNDTPKHRDNFLKLAEEGFYDGTLFHRVIKNFMFQGGDPDSRSAEENSNLGYGGPKYTIPAEIKPRHFHKKGALSAARKSDRSNPEKNSSSSQFFVVQGAKYGTADLDRYAERYEREYSTVQRRTYKVRGGYPKLDGDYTVFGEVIEGLEIIDMIAGVPVNDKDRPLEDIPMTVRILNK